MPTDPQTGAPLPYPGGGGGAFNGAVSNARAGADAALDPGPDAGPAGVSPEDKEVVDLINDPNIPKQEKLARISQIIDQKDGGGIGGPPPGGPPMGPPAGGPPPGLPPGPMGGM